MIESGEQTGQSLPKLNVFSQMFSLLNPRAENIEFPNCLQLPALNDPGSSQVDLSANTNSLGKPSPKKAKRKHRKPKRVTACPHIYKKHYARSMCNACYHRFGRIGLAWNCGHPDRKLYAKGKCEVCYIKQYMESNNA